MTSQEKDAAKLILMVNAVKLVMLNQELEPHLRVSRAEMMQCIPVMASKSARVLCVGNVVAYYTHSEAPSNNAKTLYPDEYMQVEAEIIGNLRVQNFLSARKSQSLRKKKIILRCISTQSCSAARSTTATSLSSSTQAERNISCTLQNKTQSSSKSKTA